MGEVFGPALLGLDARRRTLVGAAGVLLGVVGVGALGDVLADVVAPQVVGVVADAGEAARVVGAGEEGAGT